MDKLIFTDHAKVKFKILSRIGWYIRLSKIRSTIEKPKWKGTSRFGQETAMSLLNHKHILRVIFERNGDIIKVITFHPARRGKYESEL